MAIANIWKNSYGYLLEISENGRVVSSTQYKTKPEAKRAANMYGAKAWNY